MENRATLINPEATNKALKRKALKAKFGKIAANAFVDFVLLLMYLPIIYITVFSFAEAPVAGKWDGFSFGNYIELFDLDVYESEMIWKAAKNTAIVAVVAAIISTILGTLGAIGIYYLRRKWKKNVLDFMTQIPVVNAEVVTAIALVALYAFISRYLFSIPYSFVTLIIGHVVISIPYVIMSVGPKLEQMDSSLYEAAMDLGATQKRALLTVVVPDILPGILSGFMLAVTLSLDDYVITAFTAPKDALWEVSVGSETISEFKTLSTYVEGTMRLGMPIELRSFTALLFGVILLVMIGIYVKNGVNMRKQKKLLKGVD